MGNCRSKDNPYNHQVRYAQLKWTILRIQLELWQTIAEQMEKNADAENDENNIREN